MTIPDPIRAFHGAIYDILVTYADATPGDRDRFLAYLCDGAGWHEWRFMGSLGMGGKLYHSGGRYRVGCYPEDETAKRRATVTRVQAEIDALVGEWARRPSSPSDRPPVGAEPGSLFDRLEET